MKKDRNGSAISKLYVSFLVVQIFLSIFAGLGTGLHIDMEEEDAGEGSHQIENNYRAGNGTVNKTFYLHDDGAYNITDNWDLLNTTGPMNPADTDYDGEGSPGVLIDRDNNFQCWNVTPEFAEPFRIKGDVVIDVWIKADDDPNLIYNLSASLIDENQTSIGVSYHESINWPLSWTKFSFVLSNIDYNISEGGHFYLNLSRLDDRPHSTHIMYDNYTCPSRITIPTTTYVNVTHTGYYDTTDSIRNPPTFSDSEDVVIKANVTDPIGSYDIRYPGGAWNNSGANVTVWYPDGSVIPGYQNKSMALEFTDTSSPSAWKLFNTTLSNTSITQAGVYNVTVTGWESNGVYVQQDSNFTVNTSENIPPQITNVTDVPDPQESGFNVNISADVTDNVAVGDVMVNITSPNGTTLGNFSMNYSSSTDHAYFNRTYYTIGLYNYTILAHDTSNNWNSSSQYNFTIQDTLPPVISDVKAVPDPQVVYNSVNITCNVTDDLNVSDVFVNITSPLGTNVGNYSMNSSIDDTFYMERAYDVLGTYTFSVWANDTEDNRNISTGHTFVIYDPERPMIENVTDMPDPQATGGYVNISCNVTDNVEVGEVSVNVTSPSGTILGNYSMNYSSSSSDAYFNRTYVDIGTYDYTIWANDTSNNWNSSVGHTFMIFDPGAPKISDVDAQPDPQVTGGNVNITCNVTDDFDVWGVWVNITTPSGATLGNYSMNYSSITNISYFNTSYTVLGTYNFTIWANDTSNNWNSSSGHTFMIYDPNIPKITNVDAQPDPQVTGGNVNITCNVTDDTGVSEVWVNITAPSGITLGNYSMNYSSATNHSYFNRTYTELGTYDYTVCANDTSNNWNSSTGHTFLIYDPDLPNIKNVSADPDPQEVYGNVNISAEVTDNIGVGDVWVNITLPDGSELGNFSMNYSSITNISYFNRSYGVLGTYNYIIGANDTDNNWNYSGTHNFVIEDTQEPSVGDNTAGPPTTGDPLNINASVFDNHEIHSVQLYYWTDVSAPTNVSMTHSGADYYEYSISIPSTATILYYNISANDTSDNWNQTGEIVRTVIDNDPPSITDNSPATAASNAYFVINVTVADNLDVDKVFACHHTDITGWSNSSMINTGGDYYELNVSLPDGATTFYYNVTANDTSDNWNTLGTRSVDLPEDTVQPEEIIIVSGDEQEQTVGTALTEPFVVKVLDSSGDPVGSGIEVWFNITSTDLNGDAELDKSSPVLTDANGSANVTLTLDSKAGVNTVNASIRGRGPGTWTVFTAYGVIPHFEVAKTVDKNTVDPGDELVYTIYYNNTGTEEASDVWINDTISSELEYMGDDSGVSPILIGQTLSWHLTGVGTGEHSFQLRCKVKADSDDGTEIYNSFDIDYRDGAGSSYSNTSNQVNSIVTAPVFNLGKSVNTERARANDNLMYVIYFNNIGTGNAGEVWINDTLSRHVMYLNDSSGVSPRIVMDGDEKTYCWHFRNMGPGSYSFTVNVSIDSDTRDGTLISNIALLDYSSENGVYRQGLVSNKVTTSVYTLVDNIPPTIEGVPDLIVHFDFDYTFNLSSYVSDPDNTSSELGIYFSDPAHARVNATYHLGMILNYPESMNGTTVELTIWVTDGIASDYQTIDVLVTNNFPPEIREMLPDATFHEDQDYYGFNITRYFFDRDKNALYYSSGEEFLNVTILENGTVLFKPPENWYGIEVITFRATEIKISDITGALVEDTIIVTVLPVNDAPIIDEVPTQKGKADKSWSMNLSSYLRDVDDPLANLTISVDSKYVTVSGHELIFDYPEGIPDDEITVTVSDGKSTSSRDISIKVKQPTLLERIYWPWPIVPFLLMIPLIGFAYYRKNKIEQVFLIYGSGLLIAHESSSGDNQMDEDIFSSMLSVIQDFVKDSFQEAENYGIKKLEFGNRKILVERGQNVFMAVLYSGRTSTPVENKMRDTLIDIEREFGDELEEWDGDLEKLKGVREHLKELF